MKIAQPTTMLSYLPMYIAAEGKKYEIQSYDLPSKAIEATVKGEADIAIGDPLLFSYYDFDRNNIRIFSGFINKIFISLVTFSPFISHATKKELSEKTLVTYPEPSTAFFLSKVLAEEYSLKNIIQTPFNTEIGALMTQEADIGLMMEPNIQYSLKNGAKELINFLEWKPSVMTSFQTTSEIMRGKGKEISQFKNDILSGIETFGKDEEKTLEVAKKYFPLAEEGILKAAISKLRKNNIYCEGLKFKEAEIQRGLEMRQIKMPLGRALEYFE